MAEEKRCANCFYAKKLFASNDVICEKKGVVDQNGLCKKYSYNIFKTPPPKKRDAKQYDEGKFTL